ncbi:phosphatidylinositol-glycan biosynthesis class X protein-like isoform X2 [Patiria miniata]|uniref:Phosphatidylinositol-glycan biosynthesis class X protein n=1 Tax=Patiria miniata TaxID=46514 RepID=A0A914B012_PATMI|nr:phosphatidylinositol-glycan biosynthesis class X protein-like isoform X2 [Patiria miniata]
MTFDIFSSRITEQLSNYNEDFGEDSCKIVPKDVQLTRHSSRSGFHRDIHTSVSVLLDQSHHCTSCHLLLIERLPGGLYVDLYQSAAAVDFGGPQILAFEEIDLEKPAYLSAGHTILVYPSSSPQIIPQGREVVVNFTTEMPIHLRYHRPSAEPDAHSAHVSLPSPYALIRCTGASHIGTQTTADDDADGLPVYKAPCSGTSNTNCLWRLLPQSPRENHELHFQVPVGQQSHTLLVTVVTILATIAGTLAVLVTMFRSSTKAKPD